MMVSCGSLDGPYLYRQQCKVPHLDQTAEDTGLEARLDYECHALPLHSLHTKVLSQQNSTTSWRRVSKCITLRRTFPI